MVPKQVPDGRQRRIGGSGGCANSRAQSDEVAGQYVCSEAHVAGKPVPCTAPPLSLKSDGKFELQGREGDYLVSGNWVELNGTVLKSRAKRKPATKSFSASPTTKAPANDLRAPRSRNGQNQTG